MVDVLLSGIVLGLVPVTITGLISNPFFCNLTISTWKPIFLQISNTVLNKFQISTNL